MLAIFESKGDKLPPSAEGFEPRFSGTQSPEDCMHADKPIELSRIKLKTIVRPYDQWAFSPLDPSMTLLRIVIYLRHKFRIFVFPYFNVIHVYNIYMFIF